ncbi:hypothetical protein DSO57_1008373 [Entomophthora muscae]|uniref:Uncharacterized protein n=1 Tax=Entomophthora muscae TaxID=34485 RepID=A0ACC2RYD5_9FUNG|nr:hypothetical protein DSO57_1008373 [Entomophthora muscae]
MQLKYISLLVSLATSASLDKAPEAILDSASGIPASHEYHALLRRDSETVEEIPGTVLESRHADRDKRKPVASPGRSRSKCPLGDTCQEPEEDE